MTLNELPASGPAPDPATDPVCPFLGMVDDPATHFVFPSSAQRCHAGSRPSAVDAAKQGRDCLTAAHVSCSRYRPPTAVLRVHPTPPVVTDRTSRPAPSSVNSSRPTASGRSLARRATGAVLLPLLVLVCAVGVIIGVWFAGLATHGSGAGASAPPATPRIAASTAPATSGPPATATATATASTPASPSPTPAPTPSITPTATPVASAAASIAPRPLIHIVKSGETLSSIAAKYGVSLSALEAANRIANPNLIMPGQKLTIPRR